MALIFLIAGEVSADMVGARMMECFARRLGESISFAGIGGERMAKLGLKSLYPYEELSLVGIFEVAPHIPRILKRMSQVAKAVRRLRPDVVVCIDTSGFARGVARRLGGDGVPIVQYKAPQAWAYWPWRAKKMARYFDHVLAILPFEPAFFERYNVACSFIGHPALESGVLSGQGRRFRDQHGVPRDAPLLCVLPGSRASETAWSLDIFSGAASQIATALPDLHIAVPTVAPVAARVKAAVDQWPIPTIVIEEDAARFDAFAASDAAVTVTGTATAELALARVPMVGCYRLNTLTYWIAKQMASVRYLTLANLVLDRPAVPELIQHDCRPDKIAESCIKLLTDPETRKAQLDAFAEIECLLRSSDALPTERAVETIIGIMRGGG